MDEARLGTVTDKELDALSQELAADEQSEREALEWIEAVPDEGLMVG